MYWILLLASILDWFLIFVNLRHEVIYKLIDAVFHVIIFRVWPNLQFDFSQYFA